MFERIARTNTSVKIVIKVDGKPVVCTPEQVYPDGTFFARANDCLNYPDEGTLYMFNKTNFESPAR